MSEEKDEKKVDGSEIIELIEKKIRAKRKWSPSGAAKAVTEKAASLESFRNPLILVSLVATILGIGLVLCVKTLMNVAGKMEVELSEEASTATAHKAETPNDESKTDGMGEAPSANPQVRASGTPKPTVRLEPSALTRLIAEKKRKGEKVTDAEAAAAMQVGENPLTPTSGAEVDLTPEDTQVRSNSHR